jgi:hypothetical protein
MHNMRNLINVADNKLFESETPNKDSMMKSMADNSAYSGAGDPSLPKDLAGWEKFHADKKAKAAVTEAEGDENDPDGKAAHYKNAASAYEKEHGKGSAKSWEDIDEDIDEDNEEQLEESPTMDTTQLVSMLHNAGLSEEAIETKITEWANSPANASETAPTSHGDPYDYAQPVNLSLKRYMDAEDKKVTVAEHTVEAMKSLYEESKNKTMVKGPDGNMVPDYAADGKGKDDLKKDKDINEAAVCDTCECETCECDTLEEAQSPAQKKAFADMLGKDKDDKDDEKTESLEESKELALLLKNAGL